MRRLSLFALLVAACLAAGGSLRADTLERVRDGGTLRLGFRMDAKPLSFLNPEGEAAGYAVDICRRIAAALQATLGLAEMAVEYIPVTAEDRFAMLLESKIDIECATSTRTLERQARVDFTLLTFVTGADMLVRLDTKIDGLEDIAGRKVGVLAGTTTEALLRRLLKDRAIEATVVTMERHEYGIASLETEEIDAYFADRVLLLGLVQRVRERARLRLSGKLLSFEPYAFMVRRGDAELRLVADRTIAALYRSGEIEDIYRKWFKPAEPSDLLRALYVLQAIPER